MQDSTARGAPAPEAGPEGQQQQQGGSRAATPFILLKGNDASVGQGFILVAAGADLLGYPPVAQLTGVTGAGVVDLQQPAASERFAVQLVQRFERYQFTGELPLSRVWLA